MSTTVLPQLREIEADLSAQEEALSAELQELREKLNGIRAVLPMFDGTTGELSVPAQTEPADEISESEEVDDSDEEDSFEPEALSAETASVEAEPEEEPEEEPESKPARKTKRKSSTSKKKDGRTASWQKYTRPGVRNESIPDAVKLILETQPDKEFKIAEVMEALFLDDMPKTQYLKARNRISNVLSGGVRAGDWYRGGRSTYRLTAE